MALLVTIHAEQRFARRCLHAVTKEPAIRHRTFGLGGIDAEIMREARIRMVAQECVISVVAQPPAVEPTHGLKV